MSARVTQNPLKMPDIRLHAIPNSHNYRSGFLLLRGVHIRIVRHCSDFRFLRFVDYGFGELSHRKPPGKPKRHINNPPKKTKNQHKHKKKKTKKTKKQKKTQTPKPKRICLE